MKTSTQIKLILEDFDKIYTQIDADCPLGRVYDYATVLLNFALQQMEQATKQMQQPTQNPEVAVQEEK
jgi:alpha-D-ribose 1-methylphosphonate 5-triphosphate synthase subunit PhnI